MQILHGVVICTDLQPTLVAHKHKLHYSTAVALGTSNRSANIMRLRGCYRKRKLASRDEAVEIGITKDALQCVVQGDDYVWDDFTVVDEVDNRPSEVACTSNTTSVATTPLPSASNSSHKILSRANSRRPKRASPSRKMKTASSSASTIEPVEFGLDDKVQLKNQSPSCTVSLPVEDSKTAGPAAVGGAVLCASDRSKKQDISSTSCSSVQKPHVLRISLPHFNWLEEKIQHMMEDDRSRGGAGQDIGIIESTAKSQTHSSFSSIPSSSAACRFSKRARRDKREPLQIVLDDDDCDFDVPILSLPEEKIAGSADTDINHILIPPVALSTGNIISGYPLDSYPQTMHAFLTNGIPLDASEDENEDNLENKQLQINEDVSSWSKAEENLDEPLVINLDPVVVEDRSLPPKKWHYQSRQNIANENEDTIPGGCGAAGDVVCAQNKTKTKIRTPPLAARLKDRGPVQAVNPLIVLDAEPTMEDSVSSGKMASSNEKSSDTIAKLKRKPSIVKVRQRKSNKKVKNAQTEELLQHTTLELHNAKRANVWEGGANVRDYSTCGQAFTAQISPGTPLNEHLSSQEAVYQSEGQLRLLHYQQQQHLIKQKLLLEQHQFQQQLHQQTQPSFEYYRYEQNYLNKKIQQYQLQQQQQQQQQQHQQQKLQHYHPSFSPYSQYYCPSGTFPIDQPVANHLATRQKLQLHLNKQTNPDGLATPTLKATHSPTSPSAWRACYPSHFQQYGCYPSSTSLLASTKGMHYYPHMGAASAAPQPPAAIMLSPTPLPTLPTTSDKAFFSPQQAALVPNRYPPSTTFMPPSFCYDYNSTGAKMLGEQTFYYTNAASVEYHQSRPDYSVNKAQKTNIC